jgi:hypothetical protein
MLSKLDEAFDPRTFIIVTIVGNRDRRITMHGEWKKYRENVCAPRAGDGNTLSRISLTRFNTQHCWAGLASILINDFHMSHPRILNSY